jgi:hypothetical protein
MPPPCFAPEVDAVPLAAFDGLVPPLASPIVAPEAHDAPLGPSALPVTPWPEEPEAAGSIALSEGVLGSWAQASATPKPAHTAQTRPIVTSRIGSSFREIVMGQALVSAPFGPCEDSTRAQA